MCKFYRYLSYRIYTFCQNRGNPTPASATGSILYILHLFQYLGLACLFPIFAIPDWDRGILYIVAFILLVLHWKIWTTKRLEKYVEEFKGEKRNDKIIRGILILGYFIGTYIIVGIIFVN